MDNLNLNLSNRKRKILDYLKKYDEAKTETLAELCNTSLITIRRDLKDLDNSNLIERHYGGAKLIKDNITSNNNLDKKNAIAKYASTLVEDGDTIFINSSSTAILMLNYLKNKRVSVITNNGNCLLMDIPPNIELIITGGEVYGRKKSMIGDLAIQTISTISAQKCFIGVSGIDANLGISTSVLKETTINKKMINQTKGPVYVLTTSDKLGVHHNFSSGEASSINCLITDHEAELEKLDELENVGIQNITIDYTKYF